MATIYINGKFTCQRMTGVQRYATEVVRALDSQSAKEPLSIRFVLLLPRGATKLNLDRIEQRHVGGFRNLHLWEQFSLWRASRDGLLLNLGGTAPLGHSRQAVTLFDAAVFDYPEAYTSAFANWYRFAFRMLGRSAKIVLTTSEFSKARLSFHLSVQAPLGVTGASGDHVAIVPSDSGIIDDLGLRETRYLLAVGSGNPTKNFARLVAAFEDIAAAVDAKMLVVGRVNSGVFAGGGEIVAGGKVIYAGAVSDEQLKALYEGAWSFVFPSLYEGFGLPPLEAMVCGCPVIAARAASIPEVCGEAALYFDPSDIAAISRAMHRVLTDQPLRLRLACEGQLRAQQFSWHDVADKVIRLLRPLAA